MTVNRPETLDIRFWGVHLVLPMLLFVVLAMFCELTHIDLILADLLYDFREGCWPARESFWASWLIHRRGRDLVVVIASGAFLAAVGSFLHEKLRPWRREAIYLFLAIIIGTSLVTAGKNLTNRHCPWDMDRYGGKVPYTNLFEGTPKGFPPGRCFPAGHAAGGFALMSLYFVFRDRNKPLARAMLAAGFLTGFVFGYAQMARGAHFFSHNVWTAAICWLVALFLYPPIIRGWVPVRRLAPQGVLANPAAIE